MSSPIRLVAEGFYVQALHEALKDPSLWNANTIRTQYTGSPHEGTSDIWARYATDYKDPGPFTSIWYPIADLIPVKGLVEQVVEEVGGGELGGVLITKVPVDGEVKPHTDSGWHATSHRKFGLSVAANENQAFCFDEESLVTKPGDLFEFDNSKVHWVYNKSNEDRITVIICIRKES